MKSLRLIGWMAVLALVLPTMHAKAEGLGEGMQKLRKSVAVTAKVGGLRAQNAAWSLAGGARYLGHELKTKKLGFVSKAMHAPGQVAAEMKGAVTLFKVKQALGKDFKQTKLTKGQAKNLATSHKENGDCIAATKVALMTGNTAKVDAIRKTLTKNGAFTKKQADKLIDKGVAGFGGALTLGVVAGVGVGAAVAAVTAAPLWGLAAGAAATAAVLSQYSETTLVSSWVAR